ncbi:dentin sialophosphoprotein-like [Heteronotia binoei]|uniref:dentin sialophosphoprotein-like n=1 Tax=Heteronotia binoei TaxID=13085 RepID=UPI00292DF586|nr:dentin sialophosphoprotein-like [Heteronotia binoei]
MEKYPFFVVLFCAAFTAPVLGFPYGDVSIACDSMLPDHGSAPQKSSPPFVISVSFDRYDPGNEIQVILEGTARYGFKGFMLQAREVGGNIPVGKFRIIDRNTQGLACANISNSAVSHTNPRVKHQVRAIWVAPRNTRKIRLMGTFVQDYDTYWVGVHSKTLSPRDSDATNDSKAINDSMTTSTSVIANDSVTSVVSENTTDSDTSLESDENFDFNALIGPEIDFETPEKTDDSNRENETLEKTEEPKRGNSTRKGRRKSIVNVQIKCGKDGSGSGSCGQGSKGYSQSGGSQSKVVVVKQGSSSGCIGGGVADVYSKHACRDSAADISGQSSYGKSVSVEKGPQVVSYPDSQPFPPERDTYSSKYSHSKIIQSQSSSSKIQVQGGQISSSGSSIYGQGGKISSSGSSIYGQGSYPQSGPSKGIRITIESGQSGRVCDKSSSSYNSDACIKVQTASSQGSSTYGTQGQSSHSQSSSSSYGTQQGGSYSSGGKPCGQGTTYDSNPCNQGQSSQSTYNQGQSSSSQNTYNQAGSQFQGNSNPCNPSKGTSYNSNRC